MDTNQTVAGTTIADAPTVRRSVKTAAPETPAVDATHPRSHGQIVLVLQGGGALGAYQAGVFHALHEAGVEPDWVIGTSIGAINAALIAGNPPERRLARLTEFWRRMKRGLLSDVASHMPFVGPMAANWVTMTSGIRGFFQPNPWAFFGGACMPLGAEEAGFYSTGPLRETLGELVDFERINTGPTRLIVGAANVRTSEMRYFDSREETIDVRHVLASGALPPAFPAVRIGEELFWDGGVLSNTPVEAVFDDRPRRDGVVFAVHVWNPRGAEPQTLAHVFNRQKDLQYSSRAATQIARQRQIHNLRRVIAKLGERIPEAACDPEVKDLLTWGCRTRMHVVRLLASPLLGEDHSKDIDFSPDGIRKRWEAGFIDTTRVLSEAPWSKAVDPLEGFILHEAAAGVMVAGAHAHAPVEARASEGVRAL